MKNILLIDDGPYMTAFRRQEMKERGIRVKAQSQGFLVGGLFVALLWIVWAHFFVK